MKSCASSSDNELLILDALRGHRVALFSTMMLQILDGSLGTFALLVFVLLGLGVVAFLIFLLGYHVFTVLRLIGLIELRVLALLRLRPSLFALILVTIAFAVVDLLVIAILRLLVLAIAIIRLLIHAFGILRLLILAFAFAIRGACGALVVTMITWVVAMVKSIFCGKSIFGWRRSGESP
jgi:hypothetical protein